MTFVWQRWTSRCINLFYTSGGHLKAILHCSFVLFGPYCILCWLFNEINLFRSKWLFWLIFCDLEWISSSILRPTILTRFWNTVKRVPWNLQKYNSELNSKRWRSIFGQFPIFTSKLSEVVDIDPKWCQNTLINVQTFVQWPFLWRFHSITIKIDYNCVKSNCLNFLCFWVNSGITVWFSLVPNVSKDTSLLRGNRIRTPKV